MKRGTRPFIVEVRRGQKRAQSEGEEGSTALRSEALRRAEAALFGTAPTPQGPIHPEPVAPPEPPRRILASLADVTPADAIPQPEPARRRGRKPKLTQKVESTGARRSKRRAADKTLGRSVPLTPELVSAALDTIKKATTRAAPRRPAAGSPIPQKRSAAVPGRLEKAKKLGGKKGAASRRHSAHGRPQQEASVGMQQLPLPLASKQVERPISKLPQASPVMKQRGLRPSIRGRYVFGTELKPGERWKRRLRWSRKR